jgi:hypothetical protein
MTVFRAKLKKEKLLEIPEIERNLFISLAHLQNEIRFSLYGVVWTHDFSSENEAIVQSQIAFNFFYLRILAGKLHEGWQLLQKHFFSNQTLSIEFNSNGSEEARNALKELKKYFSKKNAISEIRNNLSFHYNPGDLLKPINEMKEDLDLYISKDNDANTLYYFAEALANWAVISKVDNPENLNPLELINGEVTSIAKIFNTFNKLFMSFIIKKYKPEIWDGVAEKVVLENLTKFREVHIPLFTDTSDGFI